MSLRIFPLDLSVANALVEKWHRHHRRVPGAKFCIGVQDGERICGAAIVGRPVARRLDNGMTLEVNRVATDGTPNGSLGLIVSWVASCLRAKNCYGKRRQRPKE